VQPAAQEWEDPAARAILQVREAQVRRRAAAVAVAVAVAVEWAGLAVEWAGLAVEWEERVVPGEVYLPNLR